MDNKTIQDRGILLLFKFINDLQKGNADYVFNAYINYSTTLESYDGSTRRWPYTYDLIKLNPLTLDGGEFDIHLSEIINTRIFSLGVDFKAHTKSVWNTHQNHITTYIFLPFYSTVFHVHSRITGNSTPKYVFLKTELNYQFNIEHDGIPHLSVDVTAETVEYGLIEEMTDDVSILLRSLFPPDHLSPVRYETGDLFDTTTCPLTKRQLEVLKYTSAGYQSIEVADLLNISVHTVNNHKSDIRETLQLNTIEAITKAKQEGWFK